MTVRMVGLNKFIKTLDDVKHEFLFVRVARLMTNISVFYLEGVVKRTRVKTGRAKGGWGIRIGTPPTTEGGPDPEGVITVEAGRRRLNPLKTFPYVTVFIDNPVPYAAYLNDTLGDKMVERTHAEGLSLLPAMVEAVYS